MKLPRILPMAAAAAMSFFMLSATVQPVYAAGGPDYRLTTKAETKGRYVAANTLWSCTGGGCSAQSSTSRPAVVCAQIVREVGALESFSFKGEAFGDEALAKCNARAR